MPIMFATPPSTTRPGVGKRWLWATLAGLAAAVPVSVLLSFAALLPMYLGPFFFLLFGLVIGAAIYRVARNTRPAPITLVVASSAFVTIATFMGALNLEYHQFGPHVARIASKRTRELPPYLTPSQFQASVRTQAERVIDQEYPPGGLIGYLRWAATDGQMVIQTPQARPPAVTYAFSQSKLGFILRVLLSFSLLAGGVASQVASLRKPDASRTSPDDPARTVASDSPGAHLISPARTPDKPPFHSARQSSLDRPSPLATTGSSGYTADSN